MEFEAVLAREIKLMRLKSGMSQAQLAAKVGLDVNYISKIERNKRTPRIGTLLKICHALNSTLAGLIMKSEEQIEI